MLKSTGFISAATSVLAISLIGCEQPKQTPITQNPDTIATKGE